MALLVCSKGVQKYFADGLESFCDQFIAPKAYLQASLSTCLFALNNVAFQIYLDEGKLNVKNFMGLTDGDIRNLMDLVLQKYVDDGLITTVQELRAMPKHVPMYLLSSSSIRTSFKKKEFTWKELIGLTPPGCCR